MLSIVEFIQMYDGIGKKKSESGALRLFLLGILAGAFIAFGAVGAATASFSVENAGLAKLVSGTVFPVGLVMVIISGAELFTGNCLLIMPCCEGIVKPGGMLKNLCCAYLGNLVGSVLVALVCYAGGTWDFGGGGLALSTVKTAAAKCALPFGRAFILGIACNILVCLAVAMALSAKDIPGRSMGAYLPIFLFVISGYEHCVANMYYIPAGMLALSMPGIAEAAADAGIAIEKLTMGGFLLGNLLPVTLGNIVGGMGLGLILHFSHRKLA